MTNDSWVGGLFDATTATTENQRPLLQLVLFLFHPHKRLFLLLFSVGFSYRCSRIYTSIGGARFSRRIRRERNRQAVLPLSGRRRVSPSVAFYFCVAGYCLLLGSFALLCIFVCASVGFVVFDVLDEGCMLFLFCFLWLCVVCCCRFLWWRPALKFAWTFVALSRHDMTDARLF